MRQALRRRRPIIHLNSHIPIGLLVSVQGQEAVLLVPDDGGEEGGQGFDDAEVGFGLREEGAVVGEAEGGGGGGDAEGDGVGGGVSERVRVGRGGGGRGRTGEEGRWWG